MNDLTDMTLWYSTLLKPSWAPPSWLFGVAWGFIYPLIALSFGYVGWQILRGRLPRALLWPFATNLFFNLTFTFVQFGLRDQTLSLIWMFLVVGTLLWAVRAVWPHVRWVAYVQLPYLLWGLFATALQCSIWWLN